MDFQKIDLGIGLVKVGRPNFVVDLVSHGLGPRDVIILGRIWLGSSKGKKLLGLIEEFGHRDFRPMSGFFS